MADQSDQRRLIESVIEKRGNQRQPDTLDRIGDGHDVFSLGIKPEKTGYITKDPVQPGGACFDTIGVLTFSARDVSVALG